MQHDASFGYWLMLRRQALRLQRTELADRIGCAAVTLQKIEADERRPSRQLAARLADHLAVAPSERELFIRVARGELSVERLPAPRPNVAGPSNVPHSTTSLTGREREIEGICATLGRADVRLLTLTGAPGVGKSRLALETASKLRDAFVDGVFLVALASLHDPDLVLTAITQALPVSGSGRPPVDERLARYLRARQVLLVLDNFEHVLTAAPQLTRLLAVSPGLKLLVTSRIALELSGEHRFTVLPLSVPPHPDNRSVRIAATTARERYAAVELFVQRARAVAPAFVLTDDNVGAVCEICRRLDGLPLAIELAAARAALFTPQELLAHLDNRLPLLTRRARDRPMRHMTLEHAIDWSYGLLNPAGQLLFRRLGVFVGGCSLDAAQAVCNSDGAIGDVVDGITTLTDSSLLQRHEGYDKRSRFGMLETVREFALNQLVASGEAEEMRQRHARYYLALAEAAEREWDGPGEWAWLRRLVAVQDNLRAALHWALDVGDAAVALRFNSALFSFWATCSALPEARDHIQRALALPRPGHAPELDAVEAKVLNVAGYVAAELADHAQASDFFERGLALYRTLDDNRGIAWSLRGCAFVHRLRGEDTAAEQLLAESLRLCQSSGDAWGSAWSLYALAFLKLARSDLVVARRALEEALGQLRRQNMPFGIVRTLFALGHTRFVQGNLLAAEALYCEGLALIRETPLITTITTGLEGLAMVAAAKEQPMRAARLWGAAEALREATDERRWRVFQHANDRMLAVARAQVSATDWMAAWAAGRTLTVEQAMAEALANAGTTASAAQK